MLKTGLLYKSVGIVGLIISIIFIANISEFVVFFTDFAEKYLSQDNQIGIKSVLMLRVFIVIGIILIATISIILIMDKSKKVYKYIGTFFQINQDSTINTERLKHINLYILIIGIVLGIFHIYYLLAFGEPMGDHGKPSSEGMMEKIYTLLLLFSVFMLIFSIFRVRKDIYGLSIRRRIIFSIIVISTILFLIIGEEISWGQRIFGWDSTGVFVEYNYQNETNAHNFFNPILIKYIYPIVGLGSFLFLFAIWLFPKLRRSYFFNLFFPHPTLFFLVLIMAVASFLGGGGETYEQLFTVFVLLYSFRLFLYLRFPNIELLTKEK
jgi:hypothetical protein